MRTVGFILLCLLITLAVLRMVESPYGYSTQERDLVSSHPSATHPAGTDDLGRDRATRVALALLLSVGGACCASAVSSALALTLGVMAATLPGWVREALLYAGDLSLTLPWLFLLMLVRAALPLNLHAAASEGLTFGILALLGSPVFLRVNYERMQKLLGASWVLHLHAAGLKRSQLGQEFWPHLKPLLWAQFLIFVPACVLAEANLGTLGLGLSEPLPSLGTFLSSLQSDVLLGTSSLVFLPVAIMVLSLVALELSIFGAEA